MKISRPIDNDIQSSEEHENRFVKLSDAKPLREEE